MHNTVARSITSPSRGSTERSSQPSRHCQSCASSRGAGTRRSSRPRTGKIVSSPLLHHRVGCVRAAHFAARHVPDGGHDVSVEPRPPPLHRPRLRPAIEALLDVGLAEHLHRARGAYVRADRPSRPVSSAFSAWSKMARASSRWRSARRTLPRLTFTGRGLEHDLEAVPGGVEAHSPCFGVRRRASLRPAPEASISSRCHRESLVGWCGLDTARSSASRPTKGRVSTNEARPTRPPMCQPRSSDLPGRRAQQMRLNASTGSEQ